ncbi:MAG: helix-turn-helix domain-containing protein [Clostridiales bacterium]|nr:helix-turn-helix domain-containing protein [Clostridiales bacterium]
MIKVYLNELLLEREISHYRLAKASGVPQATISDICSGKANIEKCSAGTLYKIAKVLNVSIESLIEEKMEPKYSPRKRTSFEVYKSSVCHLVKDKGDIEFIIETLEHNEIRQLYNLKWYAEALYLLGMVDYLSNENNVPLCTDYSDLRAQKLEEKIYPEGVVLSDAALHTDKHKKEALKRAIPEFLRFNIVECEVRDVC